MHCATGHNPLRMHGKERKGITYYACSYRISYGDKAAEALGHGKWQYVREDRLLDSVDRFFATRIFGPQRIACFRSQHGSLARDLDDVASNRRERLATRIADVDRRIDRQLAAIEAGVDATVVGGRIEALKGERAERRPR